jgi:DmsE family decaheme c-type cytochrome
LNKRSERGRSVAGQRILRFCWVSVSLLIVSLVFVDRLVPNATAMPPQGAAAQKAQQPDAGYVGSETCKACHEDNYHSFEKTPHWKTTLDTRRGPKFQGCEACHGPGEAHVEGGGDKSKIFVFKGAPAKEITDRCLSCHQYGEEHSNFQRSTHNTNGVTCTDCHSPHHAKQAQFLLVNSQPALCYSCHLDKKSDFGKPFHHRVNEGLVQCTDCHNQHGGFLTKQLRSTVAQDIVCVNCHTDKAGPFVFEHEAVKIEGCLGCHVPHGSPNPRMLVRSQVNTMCLECHTLTLDSAVPSAPSFHNQAQKYQACTLCHTQVHGSNANKFFFQ